LQYSNTTAGRIQYAKGPRKNKNYPEFSWSTGLIGKNAFNFNKLI
jgi:hypothetical protein